MRNKQGPFLPLSVHGLGMKGGGYFGFVGLTICYKRKALRLTLFLPFFRKSFVAISNEKC